MKQSDISNRLASLLSNRDIAQEDSWMISYIDVFLLMSTLFVLLLFLNRNTLPAGVDPLMINPNALPAPAAGVALPDRAAWQTQLRQTLHQERMDGLVALTETDRFSELEITSRVLFEAGASELSRAGEAVLVQLLPALRQTDGLVIIEGHTDDAPIHTERYPSNWELAAARATEVLRFLVAEGLDQARLRAVSYGDTRPRAPNDSEANRLKNRRVNLLIQHRQSELLTDFDLEP
jgi:chemotaxis protein MotB